MKDRGFALDEYANRQGIDLSSYRIEHYPEMIVLWPIEGGALGIEIPLG